MKTGTFPARNLLPGDVTKDGEVVECLGVAPGCCDVYYRPMKVVRYLLDDPVEVLSNERRTSNA